MERLRSGEHVYDGCSCQRGGRCHGNGRITTLLLCYIYLIFNTVFFITFLTNNISARVSMATVQ